MKKQIFIVAAFIATTGVTTELTAQVTTADVQKTKSNNTNEKTAGWNLKENVKGRISSSAAGCDIVFTHEVTSPRDAASGLATGKRQHKPFRFSVSSTDNTVTENETAASSSAKSSGGKASFSDLSVMITIKGKSQKLDVNDNGEFSLPADCPDGDCAMSVSWSWGATNTSSSKRCAADFLLEIEDGACKQVNKSKSNVKNN